jgi:hypothetical protein
MTRNWYSDQRRMAMRTPPTRPRMRTWRFMCVAWILLRWLMPGLSRLSFSPPKDI